MHGKSFWSVEDCTSLSQLLLHARVHALPSVETSQFSIYAGQRNSLCAQEVRQWHALATSMPPGECELLYVGAGYLYCLLYLCKHVSPKTADASMVGTAYMHSASSTPKQ